MSITTAKSFISEQFLPMQNTAGGTGKAIHGLESSRSYIELLNAFPPRPIHSEAEFFATQNVIDSLIDRGELTPDEEDYLNLLGTLVHEYEEQHIHIPDLYGVELLKALIDESNLRQKDLVPIFKTESIVSEVLKGQRKLTATHIQKLAAFFHLSPAAFFES
ncbi:MAG: type II toxin-antitoxin system HigA family antitoxin [Stenomitos frigidus ULC029]